jgi:SAM-dependent methyltransferase
MGSASELSPFASTAEYYARFRRPYPPEVVDRFVRDFALDGRGRLLDAGCGPGHVFSALASYFDETIAFDPDAEMVTFARRKAWELALPQTPALPHVTVHQMRAEDIGPELGSFRMVVFGNSFHWTERQRVAELVYDRLDNGGFLGLVVGGGPFDRSGWDSVNEVLTKFSYPDRQARTAHRNPEVHQDVLARSRFGRPKIVDVNVEETWSLDEVVGYMYSTSFASKAALGEGAASFEKEIRQRLLQRDPTGQFRRTVDYTILSARK